MQSRSSSELPLRTHRLVALAGAALLGGCAAPAESPDEIAERYARQESALIDEQTFEQARARSRLRLANRRDRTIESAAPLAIDFARTERWQFGTLEHPFDGTPVCAAVSGVGEPPPTADEATPRLVVLAAQAFVISDAPLVTDRPDSAVRIDSGLPIPLDVTSDDARIATLRIAQESLLPALRDGATASLELSAAPGPTGGGGEIERVVALEALGPMLDELARCGSTPASALDADGGRRSG